MKTPFDIQPFDGKTVAKHLNEQRVQLHDVDDQYGGFQDGQAYPSAPTFVTMPDRLLNWLLDLRLLRHVPLPYLLPDPQLLPLESIRFFHVDPTWLDRVVDGALSAANVDTVDMTLPGQTMAGVRKYLDKMLGLDANGTMSGLLIRSELVARWPDMLIRAYSFPQSKDAPVSPKGDIQLLRKDTVAKNIMIILFAGVPEEIRIREPHVGERFGVDYDEGVRYYVEPLKPDEQFGSTKPERPEKITVCFRSPHVFPSNPADPLTDISQTNRVIHISNLVEGIGFAWKGSDIGGRLIALHLLRPAYVQRFLDPRFFADDGTLQQLSMPFSNDAFGLRSIFDLVPHGQNTILPASSRPTK